MNCYKNLKIKRSDILTHFSWHNTYTGERNQRRKKRWRGKILQNCPCVCHHLILSVNAVGNSGFNCGHSNVPQAYFQWSLQAHPSDTGSTEINSLQPAITAMMPSCYGLTSFFEVYDVIQQLLIVCIHISENKQALTQFYIIILES
jgi:hypothetical protein